MRQLRTIEIHFAEIQQIRFLYNFHLYGEKLIIPPEQPRNRKSAKLSHASSLQPAVCFELIGVVLIIANDLNRGVSLGNPN